MRLGRTRLLRLTLIGLVVAVSAAVAWSLRRPAARPGGRTETAPSKETGQPGTTVGSLFFVRFGESGREVELRARAMLGQEGEAQRFSGVEVTLPFVSDAKKGAAKEGRATIAADECLYQPQPLRATFKGHVRVRTDDGFELETESLRYRSGPQLEIRTDDAVAFRRGKASGSAKALHYREDGGLQLSGDVRLHLEEETGPPTEIQAPLASASREQGIVWFEGGVAVQRGTNALSSQRLQLNLTPDQTAIERAAAIDDAELVLGGEGAPAATAAGGQRRLRGRRINLVFRAKGVFEEVSAVNPASLEVLPRPGEAPERRRITSSVLRLLFDEQGRLKALDSQSKGPAGPPEQRKTLLIIEPTSKGGSVRRIESRSLVASFDPVAGDVLNALFEQDVVYKEPGRTAAAERASFEQKDGVVTLSGGEPRVVDEAQSGELRAQQIRIGTESRRVSASGAVRHSLAGRLGAGASAAEPTVVLCRQFDYDPATRSASYRDNAVLRSGSDEIRAPLIQIEEPGEGQRRLHAEGGVVSTLHPRAKPGARKPPAAVEVRSDDLLYEEKTGRVVYTGAVEIRQGDILTKSPRAIALLTPGSNALERLDAGSPVELRQGARRATGDQGSYTPQDETVVLVGDAVVLQDAERNVTGRILTFQVGSDRIRVDGREEVRSEAIFRRRDSPRP